MGSNVVKLAAVLMFGCAACAQTPVKIDYACPAEDIDSFGMVCSPEEPCAVYLEITSVDSAGSTLFAAGNLHTLSATIASILLSSADDGKTWTEPFARMRATTLEQMQFWGFASGWVSGQTVEPLPRDPFLLITADGGKTWHKRPIFEDSRFVSIADFWFESTTAGEMIIDHEERGSVKHEIYQSKTSGESWEMEQMTSNPVTLAKKPKEPSSWRIHADGATQSYRIERHEGTKWEPVAGFLIHIADCK